MTDPGTTQEKGHESSELLTAEEEAALRDDVFHGGGFSGLSRAIPVDAVRRLIATLDAARAGEGLRQRAARFVATHWRDAAMANDDLRRTGMSHPLALVLAALDGETDPRQLGLSDDVHEAFRAALKGPGR